MKGQRKRDKLSRLFGRRPDSHPLLNSVAVETEQSNGKKLVAVDEAPKQPTDPEVTIEEKPESEDNAPSNLWAEALKRLADSSSSDEREHARVIRDFHGHADGDSLDGEELLNAVVKAAEAKEAQARAGAWRVQVGGRTIAVRDLTEKMVSTVNRFKEVGDQIVTFDPTHAALPWAAFRFILMAAVINSQQEAEVIHGVERSLHAALRCRLYETLYLFDHKGRGVAEEKIALAEHIVALYSTILSFISLAIRYRGSSKIGNAALGVLTPDKFSTIFTQLVNGEEQLERSAAMCDRVLQHASREHLGGRFDDIQSLLKEEVTTIRAGVESIWRRLEEKDTNEILRWISSVSHEDDLNRVRRTRLENTCEWFLADDAYKEWKESPESGNLWLTGIPGAGKTHLASKAVDASLQDDDTTAYFFCNRDRETHRDPLDILRSLCRQLSYNRSERLLDQATIEVYRQKAASGFASNMLTLDDCIQLLTTLLNRRQKSVLIVDGLDESYQKTRAKELLRTVQHIMKSTTGILKFLVASRNERDIQEEFADCPLVEVQAQNQGDIEKYVCERMEENSWWRLEMAPHVRHQVLQLFRQKSDGMFQWAVVHIEELLEMESDAYVLEWLQALPKGLKPAYDRLYSSIDERHKPLFERACHWLMILGKKIDIHEIGHHDTLANIDELGILVCQEPARDFDLARKMSGRALAHACRHLIQFSEETKECRFTHLSVREYLENEHQFKIVDAYMLACRVGMKLCTSGIGASHTSSREEEQVLQDCSPALWYYKHAITAGDEDVKGQLFNEILQFLGSPVEPNRGFEQMIDMNRYVWYHRTPFWDFVALANIPVLACIRVDLPSVLEHWIQNGALSASQWVPIGPNDTGESFDPSEASLLHVATMYGKLTASKLLLKYGADPNDTGLCKFGEPRLPPPLRFIYHLGGNPMTFDIARTLLENGARVDDTDDEIAETKVAFQALVQKDWKVASLLVDYGARIHYVDQKGRTALHIASAQDSPEAIRWLVGLGFNVNQRDHLGNTPLLHLFDWKADTDEYVLQALIDAGADVKMTGSKGLTPLQMAQLKTSRSPYARINLSLLRAGSDPNTLDENRKSPFHKAIALQEPDIIREMLFRGAFANLPRFHSMYPIHLATDSKYSDSMKALLDWGVDINAKTEGGPTALHIAAFFAFRDNQDGNYRLLLSYGADSSIVWRMADGSEMTAVDLRESSIEMKDLASTYAAKNGLPLSEVRNDVKHCFAKYGPMMTRDWFTNDTWKTEKEKPGVRDSPTFNQGYFPGYSFWFPKWW